MSISPSGDLLCSYCGSKANFSDAELAGYKEFRNEMLQYLAAAAKTASDEKATKRLWGYAETITYETEDGGTVGIEYLFKANDDGITMYMAKESVIYIFDKHRANDFKKMTEAVASVKYPQADVKNLKKYTPYLVANVILKDGSILAAFKRSENMYPLGAFGSLDYEHCAWILSRLENFCCLFEYSELIHGGISLESVFINPYTHEAALFGGWWKLKKGLGNSDLEDIRKVVLRVLGTRKSEAPKAFTDFLMGKPCEDAYSDFEAWDKVIETKLGGRQFAKFEEKEIKREI